MSVCAAFASTRARADLAAHRHEIARVRVLLHVRRARARLAPAVVPIEAFQVHGQLGQPCMCRRAPRFSERSPRRSLNCTTASDAGSVGIGPLRVDRVAPSSRARASSEEPQQLLRRSPGRDDARSGGRARAIGRRTLGTPVDGAHGRWKPHRDSVISAPLRYFVVFGGFSHDVRCLTAGLSFNVISCHLPITCLRFFRCQKLCGNPKREFCVLSRNIRVSRSVL